MKTNHKRNFKAKTHTFNYLKSNIKGPLGNVIDTKDMCHYGPGRKGFMGAKRGAKKYTHQVYRQQTKQLIRETLDEG